MKKIVLFILFTILFESCSSDSKQISKELITAADMSYLPLIESEGTIYKNNNAPQDALISLKNAGINYIRIRLWHTPINNHSGLTEVKNFAQRVRLNGLKVWLTVHYSDTWADPANQTKPFSWQNLSFSNLKQEVSNYTTQIMSEIQPDIIQIGNETNDGFLWPEGKLSINENQYLELVQTASTAIRNASSTTKIMMHFAGTANSNWYFEKIKTIDYDYIGLSYYPIWHGKELSTVTNTITYLGNTYNKKVIIAETAYPFTLNWNDWTNNIIGLNDQLIPLYPASNEGQKNFILAIKNLVKQNTHGFGFCYWGSEWVAFRGTESTNGSSWENQALWNFDNNALPVLEAFK